MNRDNNYDNLVALDEERAVLGAMMYHGGEAVDIAICCLCEEYFVSEDHAMIFACIRDFTEKGESANCEVITREIMRKGGLRGVDTTVGIYTLTYEHPCAVSTIVHYAKIIKEKAFQRKLLSVITKYKEGIFANGKGVAEILSDINAEMSYVFEASDESELKTLDRLFPNSLEDINVLWPKSVRGISTGFDCLDEVICGLHDGNLIVVGGRPSMGKTAFALSIARHVALREGRTVAIFSLEMSEREIRDRIAAAEVRIELGIFTSGDIPKIDRNKLLEARKVACYERLIIDDTATTTVNELRAKARRIKAKYGLNLIIVDYLQIITPVKKTGNTNQEITQISRALKTIAKELNVPVVALAQLSRAVDQRKENHCPRLSDLRESGSIEQDADVVMFVYREEIYKKDNTALEGVANIIVAKNRHGAIDKIRVAFVSKYASFENCPETKEA